MQGESEIKLGLSAMEQNLSKQNVNKWERTNVLLFPTRAQRGSNRVPQNICNFHKTPSKRIAGWTKIGNVHSWVLKVYKWSCFEVYGNDRWVLGRNLVYEL